MDKMNRSTLGKKNDNSSSSSGGGLIPFQGIGTRLRRSHSKDHSTNDDNLSTMNNFEISDLKYQQYQTKYLLNNNNNSNNFDGHNHSNYYTSSGTLERNRQINNLNQTSSINLKQQQQQQRCFGNSSTLFDQHHQPNNFIQQQYHHSNNNSSFIQPNIDQRLMMFKNSTSSSSSLSLYEESKLLPSSSQYHQYEEPQYLFDSNFRKRQPQQPQQHQSTRDLLYGKFNAFQQQQQSTIIPPSKLFAKTLTPTPTTLSSYKPSNDTASSPTYVTRLNEITNGIKSVIGTTASSIGVNNHRQTLNDSENLISASSSTSATNGCVIGGIQSSSSTTTTIATAAAASSSSIALKNNGINSDDYQPKQIKKFMNGQQRHQQRQNNKNERKSNKKPFKQQQQQERNIYVDGRTNQNSDSSNINNNNDTDHGDITDNLNYDNSNNNISDVNECDSNKDNNVDNDVYDDNKSNNNNNADENDDTDTDDDGDVDDNDNEPTISLMGEDYTSTTTANHLILQNTTTNSNISSPQHYSAIMHTYANPFQNCDLSSAGGGVVGHVGGIVYGTTSTTTDTTGPIIPTDLNAMRPLQLLKNSFAGSGPPPTSLQSNHHHNGLICNNNDHHHHRNNSRNHSNNLLSSFFIQRILSYFRADEKQPPNNNNDNNEDDNDENNDLNINDRCCYNDNNSNNDNNTTATTKLSSWLCSFSTIIMIILIFILIIIIIFLTALYKENKNDHLSAMKTFRTAKTMMGDTNVNNNNRKVPCIIVEDLMDTNSHLSTVNQYDMGNDLNNHNSDIIQQHYDNLLPSKCPQYFPRDSSQYKEINLYDKIEKQNHDNINSNKENNINNNRLISTLSMPISLRLTPYSSWSIWFNQIQSFYINFQFYAPFNTRLALVGNRNEPPSLTMHQIFHIITDNVDDNVMMMIKSYSNNKIHVKRDSQLSLIEFSHLFEQGFWYLSLVNDLDSTIPLVVNISIVQNHTSTPSMTTAAHQQHHSMNTCQNNCNNNGYCHSGRCHCFPGFIGTDCSDNICPVLCNGRGQYVQGSCHCENGWKGRECTIRSNECEINDCNGNGICKDGVCHCRPGFKGDDCDQVDCIDPKCSGHGLCLNGDCFCKTGYTGINCSEIDKKLYKFFPNCSNNGVYDLENDRCQCYQHYTGEDCSELSCSLDCGQHGKCREGRCQCDDDWYGSNCQHKKCDQRCIEHGKCLNGTCHCFNGWMGKHCTLNGCPNLCSKHGQCVSIVTNDNSNSNNNNRNGDDNNIEWRCQCDDGWNGHDCSAPQETNCNDEIDNDNDGLVDCADSECCHHEQCGHQSLMCITSPNPLDILSRKQQQSPTSSFFQKVSFLIEDGSVQSYAQKDVYSPKRAAVIRGQVVGIELNGLIGIRVSVVNDLKYGFTLTRSDGWFDILVNGGGIITLQFQRNPFYPIKKSIYVQWNDITVIQNPIVMYLGPSQQHQHGQHGMNQQSPSSTTLNNNYNNHGNEMNNFTLKNSKPSFIYHRLFSHSEFGESNWHKWISRIESYNNNNNINNININSKNNNSNSDDHDSSFKLDSSSSSKLKTMKNQHCFEHHYQHMKPIIRDHVFKSSKYFLTPNNQHICDSINDNNVNNNNNKDNCIIAETQSVYEKIRIGSTGLFLGYHSSQSQGYSSMFDIQITGDHVPKTLRFLLLRIIIEGNIHEKIFESDPSIIYTFIWNKLNVYEQKVYGYTFAKIYVGYYYDDCPYILWTSLITKVRGYDMEISDIGQWNLEIHKRYNPHNGILQTGDGQILNFGNDPQLPLIIEPIAGIDGHSRSFSCLNPSECNTDIASSRFFSLVTLTNSPDGSVFVGDSNLIRRITPQGQIFTVYKLHSNTNRQNFEYHIAFNSIDHYLYISDAERFQIIRVPIQLESNHQDYSIPEEEIVAGTGEQCFPNDRFDCDDGKLGVEVQLIYPKDLAFANDGTLFFSDGNVIRMLDTSGYVRRIVGQFNKRQWKPISCESNHLADKIKLKWPTSLAIHPLDGTLFFIDNHVLFKLNQNMQISILSGYLSSFCIEDSDSNIDDNDVHKSYCDNQSLNPHTMSSCDDEFLFGNIAFAPNGILYLSEISHRNENRIFTYMPDGTLRHVAGVRSRKTKSNLEQCPVEKCIDVAGENCTCLITDYETNDSTTLNIESKIALKTRLHSISAITITGDGNVYLADERKLRLYSMKSYLPKIDDQNEIKIIFPDSAEMYVFNKYGQHLRTRSIITGRTLYSFVYNQDNEYGKLTQIIDSVGHKILFIRDQTGSLHMIESTFSTLKCRLIINKQGLLESFINGGNISINIDYYDNGLIRSRDELHTGKSYFYQYDKNGRIKHFIQPNGVLIDIHSNVDHHKNQHSLIAFEIPLFMMMMADPHQTPLSKYNDNNKFDAQLPEGQITELIISDNSMIKFSQHGTIFELISLNDSSLRLNTSGQIHAHLNSGISKLSLDMLAIQAQLLPFISKFKFTQTSTNGRDQQQQSNKNVEQTLDMEIDYNLRLKSSFIDSVEKLVLINNNLTIKIEYDWNANREIYYNQSQRPILFLQYDDYGRPIQWIPNIKDQWQAHSITYDKLGKLDTWQNGQYTHHYQRDRVGRLTELRQADQKIRFSYSSIDNNDQMNNPSFNLPTSVTLKSGQKYIFDLDYFGQIQSITTPKSARHNISISLVLGAYRFDYCPPSMTNIQNNNNIHISPRSHCYLIYFDEKWQPLMRILPYDMGKVIHHYGSKFSLSKDFAKDFVRFNEENNNIFIDRIIHGNGLIERWYDQSNQRTIRGIWINNNVEFGIQYKYLRSTPFLKHQHYFYANIHSISQFSYGYRYDNQMRLKSIQAKLGTITLPNIDFTYDSRGRLESIGNIRYFEHNHNETLIGDGIGLFVRRYDPIKQRLRHLSLTVSDKEVYRSDLIYDTNNLLVQTRTFMHHHLGSNKIRLQNYTYDSDGQLIEMQGREHWRFVYDTNGNLITFLYIGNRIDIEYDMADRINSFSKSQHNSASISGKTPYITDLRGFIVQRGDEFLRYNNLGQLLQAITPNRYEVNYLYDHHGRLVLRRDNQKNITQYFYGNPFKPFLITHSFNNANGGVLSLIYDDVDDTLIMIRMNNENFYVICDQTKSPILIFDHRGQVIKEIHRSPYGHVLFDSNPNFYIPVDFHGGIHDPLTNLIHFNPISIDHHDRNHNHYQQRIYDTLIGRWLIPNTDQLLEKNFLKFPRNINMYQYKQNDPINNNRYSSMKNLNNNNFNNNNDNDDHQQCHTMNTIMSLSQIQQSLLKYTSLLVNQDIGHIPQLNLLTQFTPIFDGKNSVYFDSIIKSSTISSLQTIFVDHVKKYSNFQSNYYSKLQQNDWTDEQNSFKLITKKNLLFGHGIGISLMTTTNINDNQDDNNKDYHHHHHHQQQQPQLPHHHHRHHYQITNILNIHFTHSITDTLLRESLNILINGSHLLNVHLIMAGQDHYFLVKEYDTLSSLLLLNKPKTNQYNDKIEVLVAKLKQYQSRLNLTVEEIHLDNNNNNNNIDDLNVDHDDNDDDDHGIDDYNRNIRHHNDNINKNNNEKRIIIEIKIYQSSAIWNIRLGTTIDDEYKRIRRLAKNYAIKQRIQQELIKMHTNANNYNNNNYNNYYYSYNDWNNDEKNSLMAIKNYNDFKKFNKLRINRQYSLSELMEDSSNLIFIRKKN